MTIVSKYAGTCSECGRHIPAGTTVEWDKATRRIRHVECPVALPPVPAGAIHRTITGESKHEAPAIGHVFRDRQSGQVLTVLRVSSEYIREDGMSFGLMDDSGWLIEMTCRPATDEEAAPILAEEQAAAARQAAQQRVAAIAAQIREQGEQPGGSNTPAGETVLNTQTIYGGGAWFVVGPEYIWYCQNNGADGDDWSRNNVRTGGAGAIGWRIPFEQTIADDLLAQEQVLMPEQAERRKPSAVRAYAEFFAAHVDPEIWPAPTAGETSAPPSIGLVRLSEPIVAGIDETGACWLATRTGFPERYERSGYIGGHYALALRYVATPERTEQIARAFPDWTTPAAAAEIRSVWIDPETHLGHPGRVQALPAGLPGRYKLPGEGWAAHARDALFTCMVRNVILNDVTVDLGIDLLYRNGHSRFGGRPWALWSDGAATTGECRGQGTDTLSQAASDLIAAAIRQDYWRQERRWTSLLTIADITSSVVIADRQRGRSEQHELRHLTVRHTDGTPASLYRLERVYVSFGEDADVDEQVSIYEDETAARRAFAEEA